MRVLSIICTYVWMYTWAHCTHVHMSHTGQGTQSLTPFGEGLFLTLETGWQPTSPSDPHLHAPEYDRSGHP